jgi:hypothetical protein
MRAVKRSIADAALGRILDEIETRYCALVAQTVDFARLDAIEQALVVELETLVGTGELPAPPDRRALESRASSMVNWALCMLAEDPRRTKEEDDCALCQAFSYGPSMGHPR